ncbi:MAG: M48 family metalloprotease [Micavibrio aeruginosavorus]|uniref:M48 family metalloprotease n=1 Tax=Micavibrio aeruginosavorus TaxID=349221 RepID=A0A7T5R0M9_9BACT|nr:MAG: M48 family metalloprotease [Micavibrio aeruginosavorus]
MNTRLYGLRNYLGIAAHYSGMAGMSALSFALGNPWVIGGIAFFSTGYFWASLKNSKDVMENTLQPHPDIHELSPRLGKIARELYQASGLKADQYPIYDFKAKPVTDQDTEEQAKIKKQINKALRASSLMPNASALHLGKPVIMISEPLLALLNDDEEKAVLAHEFAHAAARHQHVNVPLTVLSTITKLTNRMTVLLGMLAGGFWTFVGGLATGIAAGAWVRSLHPQKELSGKEGDQLTLHERRLKGLMSRNISAASSLAGVGYFSWVNPAFAPLWAVAVTINTGIKAALGGLSRSLEYQADKGAVKLGANPLALITALRKLDTLQVRSIEKAYGGKENVPQPDFIDRAWKRAISTHPATESRIGRLTAIARQQGYGDNEILKAAQGPLDLSPTAYIPYETIHKMATRLMPAPAA